MADGRVTKISVPVTGIYMKKLIACLLIGLQFNCMSADPKITETNINDNTFKWDYNKPIIYKNEDSLITIYPSKVADNIFDELYYKYVVDGNISAAKYLNDNYDVCFIVVYNKSEEELSFDLTKLKINNGKSSYKFISPLDMPLKVKRLNPKGITKNIYNTIVIIAVTAAIIALCRENKSLPNIPDISINPPSSVEKSSLAKEPNNYQKYGIFSSFFHKTEYNYTDCIIDENKISPLSTKEGILFIKKGSFKKKNLKLDYE